MRAVSVVRGAAAALLVDNVDTDVIIRVERLSGVPRGQMGRFAFESLRYLPDGSENPEFVLNRAAFRGAPILLAGANFGCGSSREGAVWALMGAGVRCIVAASFGDIFLNNCFENGVLAVVAPAARIAALAQACAGGDAMRVDLQACRVVGPDGEGFAFTIDAARRQGLLTGLDAIARTQALGDVIAAFQERDRGARAWVWEI